MTHTPTKLELLRMKTSYLVIEIARCIQQEADVMMNLDSAVGGRVRPIAGRGSLEALSPGTR